MHISVTEIPIKQLVSGTSILATQPLQGAATWRILVARFQCHWPSILKVSWR